MSPRTKNIATLAAIIAPFVLFFLAGRFLIDPWELPRENKGQLLIPHIDMATLKAVDEDGDAYTSDDMAGLWTILYVAGSECDTRCKNGLYYQIRQVRQTLGADVDRVRRVILHTAPAGDSLNEFLNNNVKGMVSIHAEPQTVNNALAPVYETTTGEPVGDIFLVSPDGQIFMRYPTHENMDATLEEAENIRVDLKRTLKGSLIG
jgi:cytochrome oxidase Cu insertion factor (SCO1/SenC/PrrC family)